MTLQCVTIMIMMQKAQLDLTISLKSCSLRVRKEGNQSSTIRNLTWPEGKSRESRSNVLENKSSLISSFHGKAPEKDVLPEAGWVLGAGRWVQVEAEGNKPRGTCFTERPWPQSPASLPAPALPGAPTPCRCRCGRLNHSHFRAECHCGP